MSTPAANASGNDRTLRFRATPPQHELLRSRKPLIFFGAGVGSGKTAVGGLWLLRKAIEAPPGVLGVVCANTYAQLFDATLRPFYARLQAWGVRVDPPELPEHPYALNLRLYLNGKRQEILCRSLERFEMLSGIEVGYWWADEVWQTEKAAIDLLLARLRDKRMPCLQGLMTTTLDDPTTWMHDLVVDHYDPERMKVIYAGTSSNAANLPPGYIEGLRTTYAERSFRRMVGAEWVTLNEGQVYYAFNRAEHVSPEAEYDPALPVCWAHDFNIGAGKPMSSCLAQLKRQAGQIVLHVFDEIVVETADTHAIVEEFRSRRWTESPAQVHVYGDAAGRARDTRSKTTDYLILAQAGYDQQHVPLANPPIRDRHNALNAMLKDAAGQVRLLIHPRCKVLAKGLETVCMAAGANYVELETYEQHVTTALGYLVAREFPCRAAVYDAAPASGNWK